MIEKRGVKIYDFSDKEDQKSLITILKDIMGLGNLVPVIGAGFTKGLRTQNGIVPSVDELKAEMISAICSFDGSEKSEFQDIELTDLSDIFWEEVYEKPKSRQKERFQEYIEQNFTKVYDVEQAQRHFLNSNWNTIFTLNYDDAIESVLDINVAVPYDKFNIHNGQRCLIKLHGDAKRFAVTGDSKYCVLGNRQYVKLIKDSSNKDMVRVMENTFFSKSVLFIGCSLEQELDLMYSTGNQLEQKAQEDKEHHFIFLKYGDDEKNVNPIQYKKYGITDIVKVNHDTIINFYETIYSISKENDVLREKDLLKEYTDIKFEYLDERNNENLDYLFYDDKIRICNGVIKLPAFFVERRCGNEIRKTLIDKRNTLSILYGTNFSGKTYILLQLLKSLNDQKVYYFPSCIGLDDEMFQSLEEKTDSIILFDDKVISFEQYTNMLLPMLDKFKNNGIRIVLTINKGDVEFYKYISNNKSSFGEKIKLFEVGNKFEKEERKEFNKKIGNISLSPYKEGDTILDFLFKADTNTLHNNRRSILPKVNFLSNECEKKVRALIILVTKGSVSSQTAINLGVDDVLYELAKEFSITVQKDYLSGLEQRKDIYSGFKFILNSTYWAIRCLSKFASNSYNHETIVNAYRNIMNAYSGLENREMNNRIKTYYMLDKIQLLFSDQDSKGTIRIPYVIYEGLHSSLNWNFQFLHQEAKCELRMARREKSVDKKKEILELSYRNINRALALTEDLNSENIEYTRAHMNVTRALILINYILGGEEGRISDAIEACYEAFVTYESLCPQLDRDELKDVKTFLEKNWDSYLLHKEESIDKFNELYTTYMRKPTWSIIPK